MHQEEQDAKDSSLLYESKEHLSYINNAAIIINEVEMQEKRKMIKKVLTANIAALDSLKYKRFIEAGRWLVITIVGAIAGYLISKLFGIFSGDYFFAWDWNGVGVVGYIGIVWVGESNFEIVAEPFNILIYGTIVNGIIGLSILASQWMLLRKKISFIRWIALTIIGYLLPYWALLSHQYIMYLRHSDGKNPFLQGEPTRIDFCIAKVTILIFIFSFGIFYWLAVRKYFKKAIVWFVGAVLGLNIGRGLIIYLGNGFFLGEQIISIDMGAKVFQLFDHLYYNIYYAILILGVCLGFFTCICYAFFSEIKHSDDDGV